MKLQIKPHSTLPKAANLSLWREPAPLDGYPAPLLSDLNNPRAHFYLVKRSD